MHERDCEQFDLCILKLLLDSKDYSLALMILSKVIMPLNDHSPISHYEMFTAYASDQLMILPKSTNLHFFESPFSSIWRPIYQNFLWCKIRLLKLI